MTNIQAAIGLAQMESIETALSERQMLARWYDAALAPLADRIVLPTQAVWAKQVHWMYSIFLREGGEQQRDEVMRRLDDLGIETRPVFYPMHLLPPYRENAAYPVADIWAQRGINLPTHQFLNEADVRRIADSLSAALSLI
jgi:perosamine synthetase